MRRFVLLFAFILMITLVCGGIIYLMISIGTETEQEIIAFYSNRVEGVANERNDIGTIYIYDLEREILHNLTESRFPAVRPIWTNHGDLLLTNQSRLSNFLLLDSSGRVKSKIELLQARFHSLQISPDGTQFLYADGASGEIYITFSDQSNSLNVSNHPERDTNPIWSPDGEKVAFVSYRDGNGEIYILDLSTSELTNITKNPRLDNAPSWSPDGEWITFVSDRSGNSDIYMIDTRGERLRQLTFHSTADVAPSWSPDSTRIAFVSYREQNGEIYILDVTTREMYNLTNHPRRDDTPTWRPFR